MDWRFFVDPLLDVGERSGQLRPYVRPVARHLPLAIMSVRMRVRHQSVGRAEGARLLPVLPELFLTTAFPVTRFSVSCRISRATEDRERFWRKMPATAARSGAAMLRDWQANPSSRIGGVFDPAPVADQRVGRKGLHYSRWWRGTSAVAMRGGGCGGNWGCG